MNVECRGDEVVWFILQSHAMIAVPRSRGALKRKEQVHTSPFKSPPNVLKTYAAIMLEP